MRARVFSGDSWVVGGVLVSGVGGEDEEEKVEL